VPWPLPVSFLFSFGVAEYTIDRMIGIPEDKLDLLNQSTTQTWKRLSDGNIAAVLGMHYQMNCLVGAWDQFIFTSFDSDRLSLYNRTFYAYMRI
jgi:hypothetical protein